MNGRRRKRMHNLEPTIYKAENFKGETVYGQLIVAKAKKIHNRKLSKPSHWLIITATANGGWFVVERRVRVKPETIELHEPKKLKPDLIICDDPINSVTFRVTEELNQLQQKIDKLKAFLSSDKARGIGQEHIGLLFSQQVVMISYHNILKRRLALLSGERE